jgi:hypothetical protein
VPVLFVPKLDLSVEGSGRKEIVSPVGKISLYVGHQQDVKLGLNRCV